MKALAPRAYDSTGNGRTGTLKNGASFTNAALPALKFANPFALNLKGTSHQYVDAERLNLAHASFTVAVWAKRSTHRRQTMDREPGHGEPR